MLLFYLCFFLLAVERLFRQSEGADKIVCAHLGIRLYSLVSFFILTENSLEELSRGHFLFGKCAVDVAPMAS